MTSIEAVNPLNLIKELHECNKYLIKIYNTIDNNWCIYIYKNKHIQLDIQTSNSLFSKYIDIEKVIEYIENQNSDIKISYTCCYDDFEEYKTCIENILDKLKTYYASQNKTIHTKFKMYYN